MSIVARRVPRRLIAWYAVWLHLVWAVLFLLSPTAAHATATASLLHNLRGFALARYETALLLVLVSLCAGWIVSRPRVPSFYTLCLLMPQQVLLFLSAIGAGEAIWYGRFADGVERSQWFIAADQAPSIIAAALHLFFILSFHAPAGFSPPHHLLRSRPWRA